MRLLHFRSNHVRGCPDEGARRAGGCRRQGSDERQHLPLRSLSEHRRCHPRGAESVMNLFTYTRTNNEKDAVAAGAKGGRFLAGGTSLYDLMKLDVERPDVLVDVNGLPLDRIERTAEGGLRI